MAGKGEELQATWARLAAQLDELRTIDPAKAAQLTATINEAQALLASATSPSAAHGSLTRRLSDAVLHYESEHPSLAGNLGSIISALGQMGI